MRNKNRSGSEIREKQINMNFSALIVSALFIALTTLSSALADDLPDSNIPLETGLNPCASKVLKQDIEGDHLVRQHCIKCHSESRIMNALQAMHGSQDSGYDKEVKSIISKKIRLTNGDISRQDGRKIIEYLVSIWSRQKDECKTAS